MASGYYYYPKNIKTCDVCGKPRGYWRDSHKHEQCSKVRQETNKAKRGVANAKNTTL